MEEDAIQEQWALHWCGPKPVGKNGYFFIRTYESNFLGPIETGDSIGRSKALRRTPVLTFITDREHSPNRKRYPSPGPLKPDQTLNST